MRISALAALAAIVAVAISASPARADSLISEAGTAAGKTLAPQGLDVDPSNGRLYVADRGNNRVDVFDAGGSFQLAWGWGVRDGAATLQTCGPAAVPPSATCLKGLSGGGAGEFEQRMGDIAVDSDPSSPAYHDVYVVDSTGASASRIQRFSPTGSFVEAWGGGVITGGATGTGNLISGSATLTSVKETSKVFEVGQAIGGAGIPAGARIVSVGNGTLVISNAATATATGVVLTVAPGPGNVPVNEQQIIGRGEDYGVRYLSTGVSAVEKETAKIFSLTTPATGPGSLQAGLEALPNIGAGNLSVTGPVGGPFTVTFQGALADTDVNQLRPYSVAGGASTLQNGAGSAEICTAAIADSCAKGVPGSGPGQFALFTHLAVGPGGTVYVADSIVSGQEVENKFQNRIQKFNPSGTFISQFALPQSDQSVQGLAVDSGGNFYVGTADKKLRKYNPSASQLATVDSEDLRSVAVDSSDNVFASETEKGFHGVIAEYGAALNPLRRFGYQVGRTALVGLAPYHSLAGEVYASEGDVVRYLSSPPPGPLLAPLPCQAKAIGNTQATLTAEINPEGKATTYRFEYVDQESFATEGGFSSPNAVSTGGLPLGSANFSLNEASAIATVTPETVYHCRVVASNADASGVTGFEGTFETLPPLEIVSTWATAVDLDSAVLHATVNPLGIPATGYFEYVDEATYQATGFANAAKAPSGAASDFGGGAAPVTVDVQLSELVPGTRYRYRLRVFDAYLPQGRLSAEQVLHTALPAAAGPDGRGYELVSPQQRNSAEVGTPGTASGLSETTFPLILAAADSGEAVTYTSFTAFGADAAGAPGASQYLSKRSTDGWTTANITPFGFISNPLRGAYDGFTPDLSLGAFMTSEPALEGGVPGIANLYLRDNDSGRVRAITTVAPEVTGEVFCPGYGGASADGQHILFAANGAFAGAKKGKGFSLYEWSQAGGIKLVSVLPEGVAAVPGDHGFGARGGDCGVGGKIGYHAISADGAKIFWTFATTAASTDEIMLMARLGGTQTIQLDDVQGGPGPAGGGRYWAASANGSKVVFTDPNRLTADSGPAGTIDLYRYDFGQAPGSRLADLTPASLTPGAEPAAVKGVLGTSQDGSHVYFAANGVLAAGASAGTCSGEDSNGTGSCNLYLWNSGTITFVSRIAGRDAAGWSGRPKEQTARVSLDGNHLAFTSVEDLTGFDNTIDGSTGCELGIGLKLQGGPRCAEVYLYDDAGPSLACLSCNPTGARPLGPATLSVWRNPYEQPHQLSDDGSRVFFETLDALDQGDTNDRFDVYEFEKVGAGSCSTESPTFAEEAGGCLFLISTGTSEENSYLIDTSADGRDVFFSTRQRLLLSRDRDERYDIYDFRAGGGFPELQESESCGDTDSCRPPATPPPPAEGSATPSFVGPGNVAPKPPKHHKGKHRKKHHKKKHHKNRHRAEARR